MRQSPLGLVVSTGLAMVLLAPGPAQAQEYCQLCYNCEIEGYHRNSDCDYCFLGNQDGEHPCDPFTCEYMLSIGVHEPEYWCDNKRLPLPIEDLQDSSSLSLEDAARFLQANPEYLLMNTERQVLQVLGCKGEAVIAQFEVTPKPTVQKPSSGQGR